MIHHHCYLIMKALRIQIWVPVTIPCNRQPEKNLINSYPAKGLNTGNKPESKSEKDSINVDMVILDQIDREQQVRQSLGDPIQEKLTGVVK